MASFSSSRAKIGRAQRHIDELQSAFEVFLQTDFCQLRVSEDPNDGTGIVSVESVASLPQEISLIIGDAVHNLRAALDHAIVQILGNRGKKEAFPVAKDKNNPGFHSTYKLIKEIMPDLAKLLREELITYDTGEACLWAVSALDNIDKHNLLIATASIQSLSNFGFANVERQILFADITATIGDGRRLNIAAVPAPIIVTNRGTPAAQMLFAHGLPLEGKPVIESTRRMAELVLEAVRTLERYVEGATT
jgi:hypothetical protein